MDALTINLLRLMLMSLLSTPVPLYVHGFTFHYPHTHGNISKKVQPLRLATTNDAPNKAMLRQIDRKIERYERKQQLALEKLNSAKAELERFKETKQKYLTGGNELGDSSANFSETTARSLVKSMMWRVIAGSVTFFTSLRFSKSISTALTIVGSDFFSKAATMFIGERLMNKSQAGRKSGADDVGRSLAKALLWRVFAICNTLTMSFLIAKNLSMASKIAGSDAVFKTVSYAFCVKVIGCIHVMMAIHLIMMLVLFVKALKI